MFWLHQKINRLTKHQHIKLSFKININQMKSNFLRVTLCAAVIVFFAIACSKDNEQSLAGTIVTPCDTVNMKYSANVLPILQANCYSCHGNGSTGGSGGISLDGYNNLQKWAANGFLIGNITHASGYVGMPYGKAKLSDCDINIIIAWVNRGYQNN